MRIFAAAILCFFLLPLGVAAQNEPGHGYTPAPPERYPVVFEVDLTDGGTVYTHATKVLRALDVPRDEYTARIRYKYEHAITGYALLLSPYEIQRAEGMFGSDNEYGVTNLIADQMTFSVPGTEQFEIQGQAGNALRGTEVVPVGVLRTGAPLEPTTGVDVAVIDTGVDATNPELNVVGGYDCVDPDNDFGFDGHGHGTHVAGTIGANTDGRGVVGVAPGARIHSVRVLDANGSGSLASVICGIDYVAGHADVIDVANMSLGGANVWGDTACGGPDAMHNAVCGATDRGTVFVVAAGNATDDASKHVPAAYAEVVTVSAFTDFDGRPGGFALAPNAGCVAMSIDDSRAAFSNYGEAVDIAAPGVCILSTYLDNQYAYASGTSMASPHVAGCVAVYLDAYPGNRAGAVDDLLTWSRNKGELGITGAWQGTSEPLLSCSAGLV